MSRQTFFERVSDEKSTALIVATPLPEEFRFQPYQILEVHPDASPEDVRKAFKRQVLKYHPDKPGGNKDKYERIKDAFRQMGGDPDGGVEDDENDGAIIAVIISLIAPFLDKLSSLDESYKTEFIDKIALHYAEILKTLGAYRRERIDQLEKLFNFGCDLHQISEDEFPPKEWSGYLYKRNSSGEFFSLRYRRSPQHPEENVKIEKKEQFNRSIPKKTSRTRKIPLSAQDIKKMITSNGGHTPVNSENFAKEIRGNERFLKGALDVFWGLFEFSSIGFSSLGVSPIKAADEILVKAVKFHAWLEGFSQRLGNKNPPSAVASALVEQLKNPDVIAALRRLVALGKMTTSQLEKVFQQLEASNDSDCSVILGSVYGVSLLNEVVTKNSFLWRAIETVSDSEDLLQVYVDKHIAFIQEMKKFRDILKNDRERPESEIPDTDKKVEDAFLDHFAADDSSRFIAELLFPLYVDGRFTFDDLERIYEGYFKINVNDDDAVKKHKLARTEMFWMFYNGKYRVEVAYLNKTTKIFTDIEEFLKNPELVEDYDSNFSYAPAPIRYEKRKDKQEETVLEKPPVVMHEAEPESIYQRKDLSVADKFMCYVTYDKSGTGGPDSRPARVQTLNYFPALPSLQKRKLAGIRNDFSQGKDKAKKMKGNKKIDPSPNKLSGWVDLIDAADKRLFDGIYDTVIPFLEERRDKADEEKIELEAQQAKCETNSSAWKNLEKEIALLRARSDAATSAIRKLETKVPEWCEEARGHPLRLRCVNFKDYCKSPGSRKVTTDKGNHILHDVIDVLDTAMDEGRFREHRNVWRDRARGFGGGLLFFTLIPELLWVGESVGKWLFGRDRKYWHEFCGACFWTDSKAKTVSCKDALREEARAAAAMAA